MARILAVWGVVLTAACSGIPSHPEIDEDTEDFSPRRARAHYAALAGLGPRPPGSEAAARATAYVRRELQWAGAALAGAESDEAAAERPVLAWLPGASADRILVVVPWAPAHGVVDDAGVATLLELARLLARQSTPYTVGLAVAIVPAAQGASPATRQSIRAAGDALVEALATDPGLEALRAVLVVEPRIGGQGRIARDLRSHPVFRDLFWRTAARLGHGEHFRQEDGWATPVGIQGAFLEAGYGRVLSLVDEGPPGAADRRPGESEPGKLPGPEAFQPVGEVAHAGLLELMSRLARVDAFSR